MILESLKFISIIILFPICLGNSIKELEDLYTSEEGANFADYADHNDLICSEPPELKPFYRSKVNGAICCRGVAIAHQRIEPEIAGECGIAVEEDVSFNSTEMWCGYTCSLRKLDLINRSGNIRPYDYFAHLAEGLPEEMASRVKDIMDRDLKCFTGLPVAKNRESKCLTPLPVLKCFYDALELVCTSENPELTHLPVKGEYKNNDARKCEFGKSSYPGCCLGQPLPWAPTSLIRIARNERIYTDCMNTLGNSPLCETTCLLSAAGVGITNESMDINVTKFEKEILRFFPMIKTSSWMSYLGPVFLFYLESDLNHESLNEISMKDKVCLFHEKVLSLVEEKVNRFCELTEKDLVELYLLQRPSEEL